MTFLMKKVVYSCKKMLDNGVGITRRPIWLQIHRQVITTELGQCVRVRKR